MVFFFNFKFKLILIFSISIPGAGGVGAVLEEQRGIPAPSCRRLLPCTGSFEVGLGRGIPQHIPVYAGLGLAGITLFGSVFEIPDYLGNIPYPSQPWESTPGVGTF